MSARYISRRYGGDLAAASTSSHFTSPERASRPSSRASMARGSLDSRSSSRAPSASRATSPTPSYYASSTYTYTNNYNSNSSGSSSPVGSRATTPTLLTSKRLRERSIPPPPPLPQRIEPVRPPPLHPSGKPPPAPARVVASDFYRGHVKSIYEREPLFNDFCREIPKRYGHVNIYNTACLDTIKTDFKAMVDDKLKRKSCRDPSVELNFGSKVYPWRDVAVKEKEPASVRIFRTQEARPRGVTPVNMPRVYVYHRSTMSPAPGS